ncbi:ATP phosphoribosyltransferase regulatory subunit [Defluviitoga tunisiensis]|uniref:ATP phosphoribosyltransferase, regulatory subunit n=1 Tax=Defluviitoga tunisiensis TaxID=1006576 RepID=A0A0C7NXC1_DEFTU|nr:ATP phosphoribosyltransferase regulatory subunit [Defluviitoga tunisiensis]CEP78023.1 ATP phosphoribosyltransferase, regulatory subunit [Defluviitoga tunisiensis]
MKKDIFAESKTLSNIVNKMRNILIQNGYYELFPPSVAQYSENLKKGMKFSDGKNFYLLKPDVTSWLIEMDKVEEKQKIFYVSEVLNENLNSTWQLGFEILNGEHLKAEEEIIRLTIELLKNLEISNFFVDVSSIKVWKNVLNKVERYKQEVLKAIEVRNFGLIEALEIDQEIKNEIGELFNFRGKQSNINSLNTLLKSINDERIFIDLGTIKYMDYYEDIVFEVYAPDNGHLLGNGGQYRINDKYACGLAFNLDVIKEMKR